MVDNFIDLFTKSPELLLKNYVYSLIASSFRLFLLSVLAKLYLSTAGLNGKFTFFDAGKSKLHTDDNKKGIILKRYETVTLLELLERYRTPHSYLNFKLTTFYYFMVVFWCVGLPKQILIVVNRQLINVIIYCRVWSRNLLAYVMTKFNRFAISIVPHNQIWVFGADELSTKCD